MRGGEGQESGEGRGRWEVRGGAGEWRGEGQVGGEGRGRREERGGAGGR